MAKNKKTNKDKVSAAPAPSAVLSPQGKNLVWAGGIAVILGFIVLSRADAMGRNWASSLSPFLILGGYASIGVGLFLPSTPPPQS